MSYRLGPHQQLEVLESTGDVLALESVWSQGGDALPPVHHHPSQDERFEVLEGRVRARIGDAERVYEAGEAFDIPRGTPHALIAEGGACRAQWEIRPPLRTEAFFAAMTAADGSKLKQLRAVAGHRDELRMSGPLGALARLLSLVP